jgi:starch synthase (maltosyl-transferring)
MERSRRGRARASTGDGRRRVVIEGVWPEIDGGRFPIKRTVGEEVWVEADVFADGHGEVTAVLAYRPEAWDTWTEVPMEPAGNDRFRGRFTVAELGVYRYTVRGWVDRFGSWRRDLEKKVGAGQNVTADLKAGERMVRSAARRAEGQDAARLLEFVKRLRPADGAAVEAALELELRRLMAAHPDRRFASSAERELRVIVDRERARFSAWYELFPRSASPDPERHGTFDDVIARLPYVAGMGFDVLYLPPIHPIGRTNRKGPNNVPAAGPDDPGSPWAIGAEEGGHTAVHPQLGTLEDFDRLVEAAAEHGLEVALDVAFQCTPDHPWVREHPEWFRRRPDGSVMHAENPPKRYEDIYPLDFETPAWRELWAALRDVFAFWIDHGVRIFRVDNPHTKPFAFWEWVIADLKAEHPDLILLSEAFTRPKVMYRLAKLGFTQSYTYFAWRHTKWELTEYLTELTRTGAVEFFRPNLWPNTPDILTEELQEGGRPAFVSRFVLAATLGASYGIYGPAFELMEHVPREPGSEEYLHSEKYQQRTWDLERPDSLRELIARVNAARRAHPALHGNLSLWFHGIDNERILLYSKATRAHDDVILVAVNLNPRSAESGWTDLALAQLGLTPDRPFDVHDLLTGDRFEWRGARNFVRLDPGRMPVHVLHVVPAPRPAPPGERVGAGAAVGRRAPARARR